MSTPAVLVPAPEALVSVLCSALTEVATTPPAELLDLAATMAFTSQGRTSVYRGMSAGTFPQSVSTPSGPRWRRKDLLKWVEKLD